MNRPLALLVLTAPLLLAHPPAMATTIGPALVVDRDARGPLRKAEVYEVQIRLKALGYRIGKPDGVAGRQTRSALAAFAKSQGVASAGNRRLLGRLRLKTAVDRAPAAGPPVLPPCKEGAYTPGAMYTHVQGIQNWADPIEPAQLARERSQGTWVQVHCRDANRVERTDQFHLGKLVRSAHFSYDRCCDTPNQIQFRTPSGKVTNTIRMGRTPDGHLTHFLGIGGSGKANRLIPVLPTKRGTSWTTLSMDGVVASRKQVDYWLSDYITGMTLHYGSDNRHKYVYFYDRGSLHDAFDRYLDGEKIHEARVQRDTFGRIVEERIRLMGSEGGTYYNRFYRHGRLVREERDDSAGNHSRYIREHGKNGLVRSRLFVNDRLRGELRVERDGTEPKETRFHLPDGRVYAVYPGRVVNFVGRRGEPKNGGPVSLKMNHPLW